MLLEVMRSAAGLQALSKNLFYERRLKSGVCTKLDNKERAMARLINQIVRKF